MAREQSSSDKGKAKLNPGDNARPGTPAVAKISARNAAAQAGSARARARPAAGRARSLKGSAAAKLARSRKAAAFTATENYATARTHLCTDVFRA